MGYIMTLYPTYFLLSLPTIVKNGFHPIKSEYTAEDKMSITIEIDPRKQGRRIPAIELCSDDLEGLKFMAETDKMITELPVIHKHSVLTSSVYNEETDEINITTPAHLPPYERNRIEAEIRNSMRTTKVIARLRHKLVARGGTPNEFKRLH